ncbi:putative transcription factor bHLH family [Helianthus annuus]|uniref:Putative myc-type, basic helix-loop-helix (BHLH) domain-containing protein n=1 Tax=Helianthus annuus TaxID=4232 RepID=A0A251VRD7_HELAN|nr:transcription factor bHLH130 isoform X2 [Helianthus annuus]KAF5822454.1 putative transcription factor bHLH family [Helianthus annuus]KAJ0611922.1 putative transcription factor bHLH family [Helianthus annuus]KAJ0627283.1 putative transcription factor bHLH family [Helianthus annuus]KAJ0957314.1 putative transcription factor bHLH family [Helianthus annuus]
MYCEGGLSDVMATDMNSMMYSSSTFKHPSNGEFPKMKELKTSDSYSNYNHQEHNNNNHGPNQNHIQNDQRSVVCGQTESSLTRYRSAPSSFYAHLLEEAGFDDLLSPNTSSNHESFFSQHQQQQQQQQQFQKQQQHQQQQQQQHMLPVSSGMYGGGSPQVTHMQPSNTESINNHPSHNNLASSSTFRSMNPSNSNLIRQSSSPAGFLSTLNSELSGFAGMGDVEKTISTSRLNNHISFSPGQSSSSMFLPQIPENKNQISDSTFKSLKRARDGDSIKLERQNGLSGHYTPSLVHHLSLPKTSSEMEFAEKILRFDRDLVPTKSRAARGCATHPRSIAERVRRTRISDRMKKLQELFPNMDKQTSTADMLDMAVQYIKDLQKDLETLRDARSKCECSRKQ